MMFWITLLMVSPVLLIVLYCMIGDTIHNHYSAKRGNALTK